VAARWTIDGEEECLHEHDTASCGAVGHPKAPAVLRDLALGDEPQSFAANGRVDLYAVVLSGEALLDAADVTPRRLTAWQAVHAPGSGITLSSSSGAKVVVALATSGDPVREALASPAAWSERPAPLTNFDFRERQDFTWAGGKFHTRIGIDKGRASFGLLWAAPVSAVPPHRHPSSWEVIALLSADGEFRQAADESAEQLEPRAVSSGSQLAVPPAYKHAFSSAGAQPVFAVQMYVPPGPEQRFKKLAAPP